MTLAFNQRNVAPNAQANGGTSIFRDPRVRQAFVEAFDRCAAVRAQLGVQSCTDSNVYTSEYTAWPAPDFDPTVRLPTYDPFDAARLLDNAGYPVIGGVRRVKDGTTPLEITLVLSSSGAGADVIVQRMQQDYASNLGVRVTVVTPDNPFGSWGEGGMAAHGAFDVMLYTDSGQPDTFAHDTFAADGFDEADIPSAKNPNGGNWWGVIDPFVVTQLHLGEEAYDPDQRAQVYQALQRYITQQFYFEPVYVEADVAVVKSTLCNFAKMPGNGGFGAGNSTWNMADWYVAPSCPT